MRRDVTIHPAVLRYKPRPAGEAGFTLVEVLLAMVILAGLATAMAGLLTSAVSANRLARERTVADQAAAEQIEYIRRLAYDDVGVVLGNPAGVVASPTSIVVTGRPATITTQIRYITDPTPTSYETTANYKRVTVTITSDADGRVLAKQVTYVAPTSRTPFAGLNLAIIKPTVIDYGLNIPMANVGVALNTGPSAPRTDVTDATGKIEFLKLAPNSTSSCPSDCYDLIATLVGYVQLDGTMRLNVGAGQTVTPTLQIYKPSTINVVLKDTSGASYTGPVSLKVTTARTGASQTFAVSGGSAAITAINGEPIVPSVQHTVEAWSNGTPLCATPVTHYVPDNYPTVLTTSFTLTLGGCPSGSVAVTVTWGGSPAPGATVSLSGGPYSLTTVTGTTNASGQVTFTNVPSGAGYTVQATKSGQSATPATASVTTGSTTAVPMTLPTGTVAVNVKRSGTNQSGATVTLTGGPMGVSLTGTTDSNGNYSFTNVPVGAGYTVKAWKCTASSPRRSGQATSVTTTSGTTSVNISFDTTNTCPLP